MIGTERQPNEFSACLTLLKLEQQNANGKENENPDAR